MCQVDAIAKTTPFAIAKVKVVQFLINNQRSQRFAIRSDFLIMKTEKATAYNLEPQQRDPHKMEIGQ